MEALALVAAALVAGAVGLVPLIRRGRAGTHRLLDRTARRRIERRVAEISSPPPAIPAPAKATDNPRGPGTGAIQSRRLLWRDTSAVLTVLGAGLIVVLVLTGGQGSTGSVLEATATPQSGQAALPASPRASSTSAATASPILRAVDPTATRAPGPSVAAATEGPSATSDRMGVLTPCRGQPDCYIYEVRRGDNVVSIANWFGIPYATVLALNPQIRDPRYIHAGDRIRLPTPRR